MIRRCGGLLAALLALLLSGCRPGQRSGGPAPPLTLREVGRQVGLDYRYSTGGTSPLNILQLMGAGAGFLDFNGDGWQDIVCVGLPRVALYRNDHGRFTDVTARSGLGRRTGRWYGCATGDYDNDGFVDLFVTGYNDTALYHNNGNGTFTDVTDRAGVRLRRWTSSAAFADVNRDGYVDLYVACYVRFRPGMPEFVNSRGVSLSLGPDAYDAQQGVLFLNDGHGRFHDVTRASGLSAAHGKGLGVAFGDAENRGVDDLVVANDQEPLDFFRNDGHGRFRNVATENGTAFTSEGKRQGGMGLDFGDYDGDGRFDLFVANFADEPKSLYHNLGHGVFENAGYPAGVSQTTRPWVAFGTRFVDLDQDGRLDLVLVNGHVQDQVQKVDRNNSYPQKPQLFLNSDGHRFREVSSLVGPDFQRPMVGRALAVGDFDNDGEEDLLAADLEGTPRLFRNEGGNSPGNWLQIELHGKRSNAMALGAQVELTVNGRRQVRSVRTDGSYLSAQDRRIHFGLARATIAEKITIRWPSGVRQILHGIRANQCLPVNEPDAS